MMIDKYNFQHNIVLTIIMLILVVLFTRLSIWQFSRAEEKQGLKETIEYRNTLPPLTIDKLMEFDPSLRFRKVIVRGNYEEERHIFLDGKKHQNQIGYHIMTPLTIAGTNNIQVLVNRGWIKMNKNGNTLPAISTPKGLVEVKGTIGIPRKPPFISFPPVEADRSWGVRWPFPDTDYFAAQYNVRVQPFYILQDPDDQHGFIREWPVFNAKHNMHIGYAIQWFAFAVITVAIYLCLSITRRENQAGKNL
ncbi:MAG: SURF1 family protein [Proteobacteria bacterium]|nr:SURF1 family protein [Pseudomonadota bacterium]